MKTQSHYLINQQLSHPIHANNQFLLEKVFKCSFNKKNTKRKVKPNSLIKHIINNPELLFYYKFSD